MINIIGIHINKNKAVSRYDGVEIDDYNTANALYRATGGTGSYRTTTSQIFGGGGNPSKPFYTSV